MNIINSDNFQVIEFHKRQNNMGRSDQQRDLILILIINYTMHTYTIVVLWEKVK